MVRITTCAAPAIASTGSGILVSVVIAAAFVIGSERRMTQTR